jgi:aspartyl-tRNA synthetase
MLRSRPLLWRDAPRTACTRLGTGLHPSGALQAAPGHRHVPPSMHKHLSNAARTAVPVARGTTAAASGMLPTTESQELSWPQRDCGSGTLRLADVGRRVTLCGWVDRHRSLGGVVFVDVRDHTGAVQVVSTPDSPVQPLLERVRSEYVVMVVGTVRERAAANSRLSSGEVEVVAQEVQVLNTVSRLLPFQISGGDLPSEEVRLRRVDVRPKLLAERCAESLKHRYRALDLRRPDMARHLRLRHDVIKALRRVLEDRHSFLEVSRQSSHLKKWITV